MCKWGVFFFLYPETCVRGGVWFLAGTMFLHTDPWNEHSAYRPNVVYAKRGWRHTRFRPQEFSIFDAKTLGLPRNPDGIND